MRALTFAFHQTPRPLRLSAPAHWRPWAVLRRRSVDPAGTQQEQQAQAVQQGPPLQQQQEQEQQQEQQQRPGVVWLVGTGPGDPSLLTLKAVRLMQTADVVLYDRLVSEDILGMVHPGALLVYVGKQRGFHTRSQEEIHELLGLFAGQGASVLRLKGGDPYVFGRGGEEVQYLEQRGVTVRAVPGITAASGISAELGIPLTHRGLATSVRFLTGHSREGGEGELGATVAAAADPHTTLVVYMGLGTLPSLTAQLQASGLDLGTPAVAVERGTTPEQRAVYAPLGQLQARVAAAALASPTLIVIGQVVSLAPGWRRFRETGDSLDAPGAASCLPEFDGGVLDGSCAGWAREASQLARQLR
ncbi:hypothetical protein CHLNCDRAFT_141338 [Chlorella variabilis]|uniref:uroporphyrinogen-III C-methyltransferase n=1 Tax=Chlorella variabilis TaxID=554065 RepID=E1ZSN5_CHLVA|nr:hypothetical protein CHLNCDRAFT_141338 [Chlorella variabilis]EFN51184.1 hypothetical protein CHLNCDRAFT_141338 [Chlorella variabilis]|eukprot:XP_005843286.1 hypothetical protein CHLNCDRAFT_141338 [Chlorella variabilis]